MDDDDVRALAALQVSGALSERMRQRGMATCPHCCQGFGSASLPIHVRRCRALLASTTEEDAEQDRPIRRKEVRSLVDLCLRFVTKHFESVCMDKIVAFPEAEAALIAAMPSNLVHRMVVNLVKESKQWVHRRVTRCGVKTKNRESRAAIENLENALDGARRDVSQLESARDWAAISRARMAEQQQVAERLQRELEATKTTLAAVEVENQRLRSKGESAEKKTLRLEAKINALNAEKVSLKKERKAQRREMEATRELASTRKLSANSTANTRRKLSSGRYHLLHDNNPGRTAQCQGGLVCTPQPGLVR
ncbi:uncharacterized protein KRP23_14820 [Phytophthora ramorum]|uniref:uncharacterized protein n=1 Tax=Phytophthora ramorum TaxID=164328 RepID=UPI0030AB6833|nr:hypothetical protein KRP23_14820 [Phytophthora ramorum]